MELKLCINKGIFGCSNRVSFHNSLKLQIKQINRKDRYENETPIRYENETPIRYENETPIRYENETPI